MHGNEQRNRGEESDSCRTSMSRYLWVRWLGRVTGSSRMRARKDDVYQQLFSRLGLATAGFEVSQPVAMGENNTVQCECVTISGAVDVQYEESNDLENWKLAGSAFTTITAPYDLLASQQITAEYVRIRVTEPGLSTAVAALGINLSAQ